jgi:hypothetical protein
MTGRISGSLFDMSYFADSFADYTRLVSRLDLQDTRLGLLDIKLDTRLGLLVIQLDTRLGLLVIQLDTRLG